MNNGIISKTGFFGVIGWLTVAGLSIVVLRRPAQPASNVAAPEVQVGQGVFERQGDRARQKPTDEDWKEATEFLKIHSPNRFGQLVAGETRETLKHFLINRWRSIVELKNKSPELYNTRVREVELDDAVFGICQRLKHNKNDPKTQAELNAKITDLYNLGLTERKQRISLVEQSLVDQKKTLESDERDKEKRARDQYEYVLAHGVEGARLDVPPHHSGKSKPDSSTSPSPGETEPESPGTSTP